MKYKVTVNYRYVRSAGSSAVHFTAEIAGTVLLSCFFAFNSGSLCAQYGLRKPVALVIEAQDATIHRYQVNTPQPAKPGAILFSGDEIEAAGGKTQIADCALSNLLEYSSAGKVVFSESGSQPDGALQPSRRLLAICKLPKLNADFVVNDVKGDSPRDTSPLADLAGFTGGLNGDNRTLLERIRNTWSKGTLDLPAQVARASILEEIGQSDRALAVYQWIHFEWPDATWAMEPITRLLGARAQPNWDKDPPSRNRATYAFLVGIDHYSKNPWAISDLEYAAQDAKLLQTFLSTPRGGNLRTCDKAECGPGQTFRILLDQDATSAAIREGFQTFINNKGNRNTTLIIFIAAHGVFLCGGYEKTKVATKCDPQGSGSAPYILSYNSSPEDVKTTAIAMSDFRQIIESSGAPFGRVLVYLDVCDSGMLGREGPPTRSVQQLVAGNGVGLLTATEVPDKGTPPKEDVARERGVDMGGVKEGHGLFTYSLVMELNGEDVELTPRKDGVVYLNDLSPRVKAQVKQLSGGAQEPGQALTPDLPVIEDSGAPGIQGWKALPNIPGNYAERGRGKQKSTVIPLSPSVYSPSDMERAQRVIVNYIQGDQVPQTPEAFNEAYALFRKEWQGSKDLAFTESRMLFCQARALLFRKPGEGPLDPHLLDYAKNLLFRSIAIDPNRAYAYNALGLAYLESHEETAAQQALDYDKAIQAFRDANHFAPYWAYPLHNLALAYEQKGNYEGAIRMYREAMTIAPWTSYPSYNLGLLYQELNRLDDARDEFVRAIAIAEEPKKRDPAAPSRWAHLSDGYNALATLEINRGRWRQAAKTYLARALVLDPENQLAWHNQALLLAGPKKQPAKAIAIWDRLLKSGPNLMFQLSLARTLSSSGQLERAAKEYKSVLATGLGSGSHEDAERAKADVRHALAFVYVESGDFRKASDVVKQGLEIDSTNAVLKEDSEEIARVTAGAKPNTSEYRKAVRRLGRKVQV